MTRRLLPAAALAAVLSACTSLAPEFERPPLPVAEAFPDTGPAAPATPATAITWQNFFAADPALVSLIEQALQNNRDLRIAVLNIELARAQWQIQRSNQVPNLNASAIGTRQTNASGGITDAYLIGVSMPSFEPRLFRARRQPVRTPRWRSIIATEEARKTAQIALVAAVANAVLALRADEEAIELTQRTLASREASLNLTRVRYDNGVVSAIDVAQAESLVESARVAHAALRRQKAQDENLLVLLVGRPIAFPARWRAVPDGGRGDARRARRPAV